MKLQTTVAAACLLLSFCTASALAEDFSAAHHASPEHYALLMENDNVLVLKMVLKPGESDVMHSHNDETVYFERGGNLTIRNPDGSAFDAEVPDGHVMWHESWSHQVTNSGDTSVIAIIVEKK